MLLSLYSQTIVKGKKKKKKRICGRALAYVEGVVFHRSNLQ